MGEQQRPVLNPEVYLQIARRAVNGEQHVTWAQYLLLLSACCDVVRAAPNIVDGIESFDIEEQLVNALVRIADGINYVLPGGIEEFASYLKESTRRARSRPRSAHAAYLTQIDVS